jgi:hypothetical protein
VFREAKWTLVLPGTKVRVVFSDDSGRGSNRAEPLTVVTAVLFDMDVQWQPFWEDYDSLLIAAMGRVSRHEPKGAKLPKDAVAGRLNAQKVLEAILASSQAFLRILLSDLLMRRPDR